MHSKQGRMARKPRIEFPGAVYHVITRGNNRQKTFANDRDYGSFLGLLKHYKEKFQFVLYAYSLMPNHVHMLVEAGEVPLSRIMQALQFNYTQKFNRRHKKVGHLFQGRYKAILCQRENYLLELIRYIVLNPVRAHLVKKPADWRWSSYYDLLRFKGEHIVSADAVLGLFGKSPNASARHLQKYVNDGLTGGHNDLYYKLRDQRILGEAEFADEVIKTNEAIAGDFEYYNMSIDNAVVLVARHMDIGKERIKTITHERLGTKARGMVAYICKAFGGKKSREVAKYFGRSDVMISRLIRQIEFEKNNDDELKRRLKKIELEIKDSYRPLLVREIKVK